MALAQQLVQGVDVWINTPRRPWEACGTSGMKVLVNGGLNLSELDGWWAEAYAADVGWKIGDAQEHAEPDWDAHEADELYRLLENDIVPEFYTRDISGIPRAWVGRIRTSMARLAPQFSSSRMVSEYVERLYLPTAAAYQRRLAQGGLLAKELQTWWQTLQAHWHEVHVGEVHVNQEGDHWVFTVHVYLGAIEPHGIRVELYADPLNDEDPQCIVCAQGARLPGAINGFLYQTTVPATRPATHFTPRVVPYHPEARIPMEATLIRW